LDQLKPEAAMKILYRVTLTQEEIDILNSIINKGKHPAQKRKRAQALLHAHNGWKDQQIMAAVGMHRSSVENLRKRFVEDGVETVLQGKPKQARQPVLDGRAEAKLVALACSPKPEGHARWTIRLLRDRLVAELECGDVSHETVRQTLKKMKLNLGNERNSASRRKATPNSPPTWRTSSTSTNARKTRTAR
jgi:transposase